MPSKLYLGLTKRKQYLINVSHLTYYSNCHTAPQPAIYSRLTVMVDYPAALLLAVVSRAISYR